MSIDGLRRYLVSPESESKVTVVFQVFLFCSLYLVLVGILGFIMNSTVFWLYWKNKKVGRIILVILYLTLDILAVDRIPSPANQPHPH